MQAASTVQDDISTRLQSTSISSPDDDLGSAPPSPVKGSVSADTTHVKDSDKATTGPNDDKNAPVKPSSVAVRYAELRPNGTFPLDDELSYDRLPDVKAYLMLLGTEDRYRFVWYHKSEDDDTDDADDQDAMKRKHLTDEAVRRGVRVLKRSWKRGKGVFVDPDAPAMDGPIPWLRATGLIDKWFESSARVGMRPEPQGSEPNYVNRDLWHGNVRMPLYRSSYEDDFYPRMRDACNAELAEGAPWRSKIIPVAEEWARRQRAYDGAPDEYYYEPASKEFPFFIHRLYGSNHVVKYIEDAWETPCELDDRPARPGNRGRVGGKPFDDSSWPFPGSFGDYVVHFRDDNLLVHQVEEEPDLMERGEAIFGHWPPDYQSPSESESDES